jgi:hypothetical protein
MGLARRTFALLALLCSVAATGSPVKFTTIDRGQQSNLDEPKQAVVRTAAEWATLWRQHAGERAQPKVDFNAATVIGVFLGSRPTGGFELEITAIDVEGTDAVVTYREGRPGRGAILSQVLTMPYHIVSIPKIAGKVTFKKAP